MASLQQKSGTFYCQFCYLGKRYTVTIGAVSKDEADAFAGSVDLLLRLKQKLLTVPTGVDIKDFVLHGGKVPTAITAAPEKIVFSSFQQRYLDTHRNGVMEANSLATIEMHLGQFGKTLGDRFLMQELTLADLQRHVNRRRAKQYRGKQLSPVTLKKEMASFRAAWNWAAHMKLVSGDFPSRGLVYPKAEEKPSFMTMAEIKRQLAAHADPEAFWESLYLTAAEVAQLLAHVKKRAAYPWIYPLFCFAAHTGARRSELMRASVADVDFAGNSVIVREKKRNRSQRTTRRIPLTPFLQKVLKDWLAIHPGGSALFCHAGEVMRSKKRGRTTGHQNAKQRPTSLNGRMASVQKRPQPELKALTRTEVHDHFKRVLAGTKWENIRGLHTLRHSFISACASKGVDQRLIDEWVGHSTEQQRKRYRHVYPSTQQEAIRSVFGEA
jgi:integrase